MPNSHPFRERLQATKAVVEATRNYVAWLRRLPNAGQYTPYMVIKELAALDSTPTTHTQEVPGE